MRTPQQIILIGTRQYKTIEDDELADNPFCGASKAYIKKFFEEAQYLYEHCIFPQFVLAGVVHGKFRDWPFGWRRFEI